MRVLLWDNYSCSDFNKAVPLLCLEDRVLQQFSCEEMRWERWDPGQSSSCRVRKIWIEVRHLA